MLAYSRRLFTLIYTRRVMMFLSLHHTYSLLAFVVGDVHQVHARGQAIAVALLF